MRGELRVQLQNHEQFSRGGGEWKEIPCLIKKTQYWTLFPNVPAGRAAFFINFCEMYDTVRACPTPTGSWCANRAIPMCLGVVSRRVHKLMIVLDSLESIRNQFDEFYFSLKSWFFENPWKSLKIHDFASLWLHRVDARQLSRGVGGAREIRKSYAGSRRRRPRSQKHVRNDSSDVPATFYGHWRRINEIFEKSPKTVYFFEKWPYVQVGLRILHTGCLEIA